MAVARNVRGDKVEEVQFDFQPAGGGGVPTPIRGLEGVVNNVSAATRELQGIAKDLKIITQRGVGSQNEVARAMIQAIENQTRLFQSAMTGGEGGVARAMVSGVSRPSGGGTVPDTADGWSEFMRYKNIISPKGPQGGVSIGGLRQAFGQGIQRRLEGMSEQYAQGGISGEWFEVLPGGLLGERVEADDPGFKTFIQRSATIAAAKQGATALAGGGTFGQATAKAVGGLPGGMGLIKGAGIAGAALFGLNAAEDFLVDQRAKNAAYQRIMGGTNVGAVGERWNQKMFGLGQLGVMGGAEAEKLYYGVAATGLQGGERQNALNFARQSYLQMGMDIGQSLEIINFAARTGQESLVGVAGALRQVTDAASEAEVNTEKARQQFVSTWQAFTQTMGGPAGMIAAQGLTQAGVTAFGRQFEQVDLTGLGGERTLRMLASQMGISYNQILAQSSADPNWLATQQETLVRNLLTGRGLLTSGGLGILDQMQGAGPDQAAQLAQQLLAGGGIRDIRSIKMTLAQYGVDLSGVPDAEIPQALANLMGLDITGGIEQAAASNAPQRLGGLSPAQWKSTVGRRSLSMLDEKGKFPGGIAQAMGLSPELAQEYESIRERVEGSIPGLFSFTDKGVTKAYLDSVLATGEFGGIAGRIAEDSALRSLVPKLKVKTPQGEKVVSLEEAMRSYRDQIQEGTAIVEGGSRTGETVSDVVTAATGGQVGGPRGSVTLGATPELRRLIRPVTTEGSIDYEGGWGGANPHVTPSQYPTGEG